MVLPPEVQLTAKQQALARRPIETTLFLEGPAGTGKTTAAVARLHLLLAEGIPGHAILVLIPQRTLAAPYDDALRSQDLPAGGEVTLLTLGGLGQRMVDLFWPLIAEEAGFGYPDLPPTFLTLETAQYYMARLTRPLLDEGYFEGVTIDRNRLYSQIIDNLNKSAVVGFPHTRIGDRLKAAWVGEGSRERIYEQAQVCANRFRRHCLDRNLLDFSLQVEVFLKYLWTRPLCRNYLLDRYRHLIVDNLEEDVPVAHDLLREWLHVSHSALLIYDHEAGYRRFLGADPESGYALRELCDEKVLLDASFVSSPAVHALADHLTCSLTEAGKRRGAGTRRDAAADIRGAVTFASHRYHPQMLDWIAGEIEDLVHVQDVSPREIVVLAPFLSDALRFALTARLEAAGISTWSHRPSRALREEPATRCLLTLAAIAHPQWGITPSRFDVAYALMQAIEGMDLVRAQLLAENVYRVQDGAPVLGPFGRVRPEIQERLTFLLGERYEGLRTWIMDRTTARRSGDGDKEGGKTAPGGAREPLDHFLSRLFGEVLSQVGYSFHDDYDAAEVTANLIESVRKFRWVTEGTSVTPPGNQPPENGSCHGELAEFLWRAGSGRDYVEMVEDGVIAAQYIRSWRTEPDDAVLLAPAYTFIIRNRPVHYQFWLNVGGRGWWERLYQPLTHPYVLSRHWPPSGREDPTWTDRDEVEAREAALHRLVLGLLRRCRRGVYLGLSELGEQGYEQRGALMRAIQRVLRDVSVTPQD
ncbi:MAG: hypothetical protein PVH41_00890 [Anaerolineae bacterium]|jgi:hypothetical protein